MIDLLISILGAAALIFAVVRLNNRINTLEKSLNSMDQVLSRLVGNNAKLESKVRTLFPN